MLVLIWVLLVVGIGVWANSWGRSFILFFIIAFLFSPVVGALVLLICGNKKPKEQQPIQIIVHNNSTEAPKVEVNDTNTVNDKKEQ